MEKIMVGKKAISVASFQNLASAWWFADRAHGAHTVLHGECPFYYVARIGDAACLAAVGYEYADRVVNRH